MVTQIGVNFCTMVQLSSGHIFSPLAAISFGVTKCRVKKGARMDHFGLSDTDFCHLTANISKMVSWSVNLCFNQSLTSAQRELSKNVRHARGATPRGVHYKQNVLHFWVFFTCDRRETTCVILCMVHTMVWLLMSAKWQWRWRLSVIDRYLWYTTCIRRCRQF